MRRVKTHHHSCLSGIRKHRNKESNEKKRSSPSLDQNRGKSIALCAVCSNNIIIIIVLIIILNVT